MKLVCKFDLVFVTVAEVLREYVLSGMRVIGDFSPDIVVYQLKEIVLISGTNMR